MRHDDELKVTGRLRVTATDARSGRVVATRDVQNLVTTAGRNLIRDLLANESSARLTHMAVGTGTTAVAAGDTSLETEVFRDTLTQVDATTSGELNVLLFLSSTEANGNDLTEAGVLTAAAGGTLFSRVTYTAITKTSSIAITYDWTYTIGAS